MTKVVFNCLIMLKFGKFGKAKVFKEELFDTKKNWDVDVDNKVISKLIET